jgi:hypothetical protein
MSQTVTISKTEFEKLLERIKTLESFVFGKNKILKTIKQYDDEKKSGKLKKLKNIDELFDK